MTVIMGMRFNDGNTPNLGSICLASPNYLEVKSFRLKEEDISKLDNLTEPFTKDVANGSDAITDTGRLFIKLSGVWTEVIDND